MGHLQQAVRQGGLPVVYMGDYTKIAYLLSGHRLKLTREGIGNEKNNQRNGITQFLVGSEIKKNQEPMSKQFCFSMNEMDLGPGICPDQGRGIL
jgi:hypothetical protein